MKLDRYLTLLDEGERQLARAFELLAVRHVADADVRDTARELARWSDDKREALAPALARYGRGRIAASRVRDALFHQLPIGGFGLLRDVHDADLLAHHVHVCWTAVTKAGEALHDEELAQTGKRELLRTERQARWLRTLIKTTAAQALTVDGDVSSEVRAALPAVAKRYLAAAAMVAPLVATLGLGLVRRLRA